MNLRYEIVPCSESGHCCFEYTVVDTYNKSEISPKGEPICETMTKYDADLVCDALNEKEARNV